MQCEICGRTSAECIIKKVKGRLLCPKHKTRMYRNQDSNARSIYDDQEYIMHDNYAEIVLRDRKCNVVGLAKIDLDDVEKCKIYKWHIRQGRNTFYAIASLPNNEKIHLHRYILNYDGNDDIDHINHDGLDNTKANLRIVDHSTNMRNQINDRNGVKVVPSGRYSANIMVNYKSIYLGTYDTYEEALNARMAYEQNL